LLDALKTVADLMRSGQIRGDDVAVTRALNDARAAVMKAEPEQ